MTTAKHRTILEKRRLASPAITPQALAWHEGALWISSRDLGRVYGIDAETWRIFEEREGPGTPWAAVSVGRELRFTVGEGADDDRYIRSYVPGTGFSGNGRVACPDFTGSYLSYDGENLYLSQWYKHRILKLNASGNITRIINIGAEVSGHTFVNGSIYVLRGTEQDGERWSIARLDPREDAPAIMDIARVPFACRSLMFDGQNFWSNHRAANEIVSFALPE